MGERPGFSLRRGPAGEKKTAPNCSQTSCNQQAGRRHYASANFALICQVPDLRHGCGWAGG
eukprot:3855280-Rhodomonas_salina.2